MFSGNCVPTVVTLRNLILYLIVSYGSYIKLNLTVNSLVFRTKWTVFFVRYEPKSYIFKLNEHPYLRLSVTERWLAEFV